MFEARVVNLKRLEAEELLEDTRTKELTLFAFCRWETTLINQCILQISMFPNDFR
jgi:hypothetical protein